MAGCNARKEAFEPNMVGQYHSIENMELEIKKDELDQNNQEETDKENVEKKCEGDCEKCKKDERTNMNKWKYTLITTVLFFIVVNPYTYKFVQYLLKGFFKIADKSGCPTFAGVLVHTVVFTLLLRGLMEMKL